MTGQTPGGTGHAEYTEEEIHRMLAEDPGIAEQGITVLVRGGTLVLCGEVESAERRRHIEDVVTDRFPDARIACDIAVTRTNAPGEAEELR